MLLAVLAGCSAGWQAPVESRGGGPHAVRPDAKTYRVRAGDTLYGIAWNAGTDWPTLAAWNNIGAPYLIVPGQVLRLAPPSGSGTPSPTRGASVASQTKTVPQAKAAPPPLTTTRTQVPAAPAPQNATANDSPPAQGALDWTWPTSGDLLATFSANDPARKGIKVGGRAGQVIRAAESGRIVYSGSGLIGYGRLIIVKHNDKYLSAYGHNRKLLVKEGDQVAKGERIAEMGESDSGHAMLHFEIRREGQPVDPMGLLPRRR